MRRLTLRLTKELEMPARGIYEPSDGIVFGIADSEHVRQIRAGRREGSRLVVGLKDDGKDHNEPLLQPQALS